MLADLFLYSYNAKIIDKLVGEKKINKEIGVMCYLSPYKNCSTIFQNQISFLLYRMKVKLVPNLTLLIKEVSGAHQGAHSCNASSGL